jgi:hypothetical protein
VTEVGTVAGKAQKNHDPSKIIKIIESRRILRLCNQKWIVRDPASANRSVMRFLAGKLTPHMVLTYQCHHYSGRYHSPRLVTLRRMYAPQANRDTRNFDGIAISNMGDGALQDGLSIGCTVDPN